MPSRFGGVPVAPQSGSRFGGAPISEASAPKLDRASAEALVAQIEQSERQQFAPEAREQFIADLMTHGGDIATQSSAPLPTRRVERSPYGRVPGQDPTENMGTGQRFAAAGGSGLTTLGRGLWQVAMGHTAYDPTTPPEVAEMLKAKMADSEAAEAKQRDVDAPLNRTPAGMAGQVTAFAAPMAAGGWLARGTSMLPAFLPTTLRGATTQGAVMGALQPIATGEGGGQRLQNTVLGGIFGAGGHAAPRAAGATLRGLAGLPKALSAQGTEMRAARVIQQNATNPGQLTQSAPSAISGVQRTLAEETLDPGIAQLQRQFPVQLAEQQAQNNAARAEAIRSTFEGASRESADAIRSGADDVAGQYLPDIRKATGAETIKVVRSLDRMANAPLFRNFPETQGFLSTMREMLVRPIPPEERISVARKILREAAGTSARRSSDAFEAISEARRLIISGQRVGLAPDDIAKELTKLRPRLVARDQAEVSNAIKALKTAEQGKPDVASLYNARRYMTQEAMPKLSGQSMLAARSLLSSLDQEITAVAPTFKTYLSEYSAQMRRADQAKIGAQLLNKGASATENAVTHERTLTPAAFSRATNDQNMLVQQATGFRRATPQKAMTKAQRELIAATRDDLQRIDTANNYGRAVGSNTSQNRETQAALRRLASLVIPERVRVLTQGARSAMANHDQEAIAKLLANPERMRAVLALLPPRDRVLIEREIARYTGAMAVAATPHQQ